MGVCMVLCRLGAQLLPAERLPTHRHAARGSGNRRFSAFCQRLCRQPQRHIYQGYPQRHKATRMAEHIARLLTTGGYGHQPPIQLQGPRQDDAFLTT